MARLPGGPARSLKTYQLIAAFVLVTLLAISVTGFAWATKTVNVIVDGQIHKVRTRAGDVATLLSREGVSIRKADDVDPPLTATVTDHMTVTVRHAVPVVLDLSGQRIELDVVGTTVADALKTAGLDPAAGVQVTPSPSVSLKAGMVISAADVFLRIIQEEAALPYRRVERKDGSLDAGATKLVRKGVPGKLLRVYQVIVTNGTEGARILKAEEVVQAAMPEVVAIGVARVPARMLLASRGERRRTTVRHAKPKRRVVPPAPKAGTSMGVVASAYAPGAGAGTRTANGTKAGYGVIAVDPKVIPLGTRVYIPGYGYAVAADTGGAIRGNRIDVCFDTPAEAIAWGVRNVTIIILP